MRILNDFNTTVHKALEEIDPNYMKYDGLVICGTHTPIYPETLIEAITEARENRTPFLGICFGHQMAAIEYARNVLNISDATSEEIEDLGTYVVRKREEGLKVGLHEGESFWNNYEINEWLVPNFEKDKPRHFLTCQYHPEYQSSKEKPHQLLVKFLELCKK